MSLLDFNMIHRGEGSLAASSFSAWILSTVAGTGWWGFSGDGGPATQARFDSSPRLTIHPSGDLYFADGGNRRIRKIDRNGIITTVAGGGLDRGDGGPAVDT